VREAECEHERGRGRGRERELERVSLRLFLAVRCAALCCPRYSAASCAVGRQSFSLSWPGLPLPSCNSPRPPLSFHHTSTDPSQRSWHHLGTTWDRLGIDGLVGSRAIPGDAAAWANGSVTRRLSSTLACRAQADAALHPLE
jgi:hypothetical protein